MFKIVGVQSITPKESKFLTAEDLMEILQISQSSAYRLINKLNKELEDQGKITIRGRVSKRYFEEKAYI